MINLVLTVLLHASTALAADRHVGSGYVYSTIQSAVNAASTGDTILVHAGTYPEHVVIDDAGITSLTIKAYGTDVVTIDVPNSYSEAVLANTTQLRIKNITIESPLNYAVWPRAVRFVSDTGAAYQTFNLTLCGTTLRDHWDRATTGIGCEPGLNDTLVLKGTNNTFTNFYSQIQTTCDLDPGWGSGGNVACSGW